jgi:hypothetical protein
MWVLLNDASLSIVEHKGKPGHLLVRSRIKGDIERVIPSAHVYEDDSADYRYRADVSRDVFKEALSQAVNRIDYANFKGSVKESKRHSAYMKVWQVLADAFGAYGRTG